MRSHGRSVRLFLDNGAVTGLVTAEIMNWTGILLTGPRSLLPLALRRYPLTCTGVYLLRGDAPQSSLPLVYVGETDDLAQRMTRHESTRDMDFWSDFMLIFSKDPYLTKAHVTWLEAELIALLREARLCKLRNGNDGQRAKLPAPDQADMTTFLDEVRLLLPVLGFDLMRVPLLPAAPDPAPGQHTDPAPDGRSVPGEERPLQFCLHSHALGVQASATQIAGEFVLMAGSIGCHQMRNSLTPKLRLLRAQAKESGLITPEPPNHFRLIGNMAFSSPTAASRFLYGTSRNGATDWRLTGSEMTYGQWRAARIAALSVGPDDEHAPLAPAASEPI